MLNISKRLVLAGAFACSPIAAYSQDTGLRDSFFWIGQINKATAVINTEEGLLDAALTPDIAAALVKVIEDGRLAYPQLSRGCDDPIWPDPPMDPSGGRRG